MIQVIIQAITSVEFIAQRAKYLFSLNSAKSCKPSIIFQHPTKHRGVP